jgi:hypothetical protein
MPSLPRSRSLPRRSSSSSIAVVCAMTSGTLAVVEEERTRLLPNVLPLIPWTRLEEIRRVVRALSPAGPPRPGDRPRRAECLAP